MFSWPMITGAFDGGVLYSLTSVPQMPATSIFIKAASSGTSGIGYSRISVLLGPTLTAASTRSTTEKPPIDRCRGQSRTDARPVKRDFHAACARLRRVLVIRPEREGAEAKIDSDARVVQDAAVLPQTSRISASPGPGEGMDAFALQASRRCRDPGHGGCLRAARLSPAGDRGRVLDRRRHAPSLQGVQAGRGGRPR